MEAIKEFLSRPDIKEIKEKHTQGEIMTEDFFRDPLRPMYITPDVFYAPADGIVLYAMDRVKPDDFLEIKGKDFTLKDLLADQDYQDESAVVGIFMTAYDVHINRAPTAAYYLGTRDTDYIYTHNISMLMAENELLEEFHYSKDALSYLMTNEKRVSSFYGNEVRHKFYVVQVGDKDVDVILTWGKGKHIKQGDRFGQIRFGSQCDVIIPRKKGYEYELLVKPLEHVEAGRDSIIKVMRLK